MRPNVRELKLRSEVFPTKRDTLDTTNNLDLNATARKREGTEALFCPYLDNGTYFSVKVQMAHPIDKFDDAAELARISQQS